MGAVMLVILWKWDHFRIRPSPLEINIDSLSELMWIFWLSASLRLFSLIYGQNGMEEKLLTFLKTSKTTLKVE